ncbi:MAG: hypothetical protein KatS3mg035_0373 [Bacteroidia bacterium]|nr:MAG: hypothetical protein KatS3mg035_0373 [Bacteroidia bacterium]
MLSLILLITNGNSQQDIDFSLHNNLLEPIFQNVFKNFSNKNEGFPYTVNNITPRFYKLEVIQPLKETEYITSLKDNNPIQNIQNLYNQLEKEIKNLKNSDLSSLSFALYYLLYKYTLRIPCYIKGKEDVSLFDAIRVITAVKNCEWASYNKETPFLLIKGDVAGIQNYIYSDIELDKTGSTQGLSKKLRGRSFLVSLLTDYFASLFISEFQVFEPHILYSGGGHFLVLLPNLEDSESKLLKLEKEINLMLAKKLSFKLTFLLGKAYLDKSLLEDASNAILNVNHSLNKAKNQKHLAFIDEIFNLSLANQLNEENLGSLIPNSNFLIELQLKSSLEKNNANRDALITDFSEWNTYYFLVDNDNEIEKLLPSNKDNIKSVKIYAFNQTEFIRNFKSSFPIHYGFKIIANYVPKNSKDKALTFEEISSLELPQSQNSCLEYKQLGILRLDVDHLGSIFAYGLEKNGQTSLMRVATLSRELHHFFAGYSNVLTKKYHIYTVYSGGDDAFFIGSWINILHFANEFRKAFKNFVCNNPNLSFSAGIFMCHPRHPIAKFAEEAAEMEKTIQKIQPWSKRCYYSF